MERMVIETDADGRLPLPVAVRERYGERYHIVEREHHIELIPVASDPLSAVRAAAGELEGVPIDEIETGIESEARHDAQSTPPDG